MQLSGGESEIIADGVLSNSKTKREGNGDLRIKSANALTDEGNNKIQGELDFKAPHISLAGETEAWRIDATAEGGRVRIAPGAKLVAGRAKKKVKDESTRAASDTPETATEGEKQLKKRRVRFAPDTRIVERGDKKLVGKGSVQSVPEKKSTSQEELILSGALVVNEGKLRSDGDLEIHQEQYAHPGDATAGDTLRLVVQGDINPEGLKAEQGLHLQSKGGKITLEEQLYVPGRATFHAPEEVRVDDTRLDIHGGLEVRTPKLKLVGSELNVVGDSKVVVDEINLAPIMDQAPVMRPGPKGVEAPTMPEPNAAAAHPDDALRRQIRPSGFYHKGNLHLDTEKEVGIVGSDFVVDGDLKMEGAANFRVEPISHVITEREEAGRVTVKRLGRKKKKKTLYTTFTREIIDRMATCFVTGTMENNLAGEAKVRGHLAAGRAVMHASEMEVGERANPHRAPSSLPSTRNVVPGFQPKPCGQVYGQDDLALLVKQKLDISGVISTSAAGVLYAEANQIEVAPRMTTGQTEGVGDLVMKAAVGQGCIDNEPHDVQACIARTTGVLNGEDPGVNELVKEAIPSWLASAGEAVASVAGAVDQADQQLQREYFTREGALNDLALGGVDLALAGAGRPAAWAGKKLVDGAKHLVAGAGKVIDGPVAKAVDRAVPAAFRKPTGHVLKSDGNVLVCREGDKVFKQGFGQSLETEAEQIRYMQNMGLQQVDTPNLLGFNKEKNLIEMSHVPGKSLNQAFKELAEAPPCTPARQEKLYDLGRAAEALGKGVSEMNSLPIKEGFPVMPGWRSIVEAEGGLAKQADRLNLHLEKAWEKRESVHPLIPVEVGTRESEIAMRIMEQAKTNHADQVVGIFDRHGANVLWDPERRRVAHIDMESVSKAAPEFSVAQTGRLFDPARSGLLSINPHEQRFLNERFFAGIGEIEPKLHPGKLQLHNVGARLNVLAELADADKQIPIYRVQHAVNEVNAQIKMLGDAKAAAKPQHPVSLPVPPEPTLREKAVDKAKEMAKGAWDYPAQFAHEPIFFGGIPVGPRGNDRRAIEKMLKKEGFRQLPSDRGKGSHNLWRKEGYSETVTVPRKVNHAVEANIYKHMRAAKQ